MKNFRNLFIKYRHALPLILYGIIFLCWFCHLEKTVPRHYTVIHMAADDSIPFCEVFVIPYFLWFLYCSVVVIYFFLKDKTDYYKVCVFFCTGMTIFLIVSTLWPNGHHLRPEAMPRDNVFTRLLAFLWKTDAPMNLWPSIHVYNSLGAHFAVIRSKTLGQKRGVRLASLVLSSSIILSTVLIKQHSLFDVLTAFAMAAVMYLAVYRRNLAPAFRAARKRRKIKPQMSR